MNYLAHIRSTCRHGNFHTCYNVLSFKLYFTFQRARGGSGNIPSYTNFNMTLTQNVLTQTQGTGLKHPCLFGCINVRSLKKGDGLTELTHKITGDDYKCVIVVETWLNNKVDSTHLKIDGFQCPLRRDRTFARGGGVALYFSNTVAANRRTDLEPANEQHEILVAEMQTGHKKILVVGVYIPPYKCQGSLDTLTDIEEYFESTLLPEAQHYDMLLIGGDFNATHVNWDPSGHTNPYGTVIHDLVVRHGLTQLVNDRTHTSNTSSGVLNSLLDLIITDVPGNFLGVSVEAYPSSDHKFLSAVSMLEVPEPKKSYRQVDDYSQLTNAKKTEMNDLLKAAPWDELVFNEQNSNDIDKLLEAWVALFLTVVRQYIPTKTLITDYSKPGWWTPALTKQQRYKTFCLRKLKKVTKKGIQQQISAAKEKFRVAKENLDRNKKIAAENYRRNIQQKLNSNSLSAKQYWSYINQLLGRIKRSAIPPLKKGTSFITNTLQKCDLLNVYFASQCCTNDRHHHFPNAPSLTNAWLVSINIEDPEEMYNLLRKLDTKRATGPDMISNKLLRVSAYGIADSVTKLINRSLALGQFPNKWKTANVVPIHKKGSVHETGNYRPISLLSCLSKICERVVAAKLSHHLETHNLLSPFQSAYRRGYSTETQLAGLIHKIAQAVDDGHVVRASFLDISKAFDSVSHRGLIIRLQQIGVTGTLLRWFRSYLSNRQQRVVLDGFSSSSLPIHSGVPQGSVLGPLLFILYIDDLLRQFDCGVHCYADDTLLFAIGPNIGAVNTALNRNLEKATEWGNNWLVSFNQAKTESMSFGLPPSVSGEPLVFQNNPIKEMTEHKHLGLIVSSNLSWNAQVTAMTEKAEKRLRYLTIARHHVTQGVLQNIYLTLIRPVMEYCCATWSNISVASSNKLQGIQNRAARLVTGAMRCTSIHALHSELGWPLLETRRKYFRLTFIHRAALEELPLYLQSILPAPAHAHGTRHKQIKTFTFKRNQYGNSLLPRAVREYNRLNVTFRRDLKPATFKKHMKQHLFKWEPPPSFYREGRGKFGAVHCQLRMGFSRLHAHIFKNMGMREPICDCGQAPETPRHYLLECPTYTKSRNEMLQKIDNVLAGTDVTLHGLSVPSKCDLLLRGSTNLHGIQNSTIFQAVQEYINASERFVAASASGPGSHAK